MMKKAYLWIALLVVLSMALSACNVPQAPTQSSTNGQKPNQEEVTSVPQATATSAPVTLPDVLNIQSGLDATDSYRIHMTMRIIGKDENNADLDEMTEMNQSIIRSQNASSLTWKSSETASGANEFTIITIGSNSYMDMSGSDSDCFSFPSDEAGNQMDSLSANNFMGGISPDQLVARGENVNGILTDHYSIKEAMLFALGEEITSAKGEVWVTPDGKYTVKYVYEAEGKFTSMSNGGSVTGKFIMTYDLLDINKSLQITIPDSCLAQQEQMADLPMLADASEVSNMSGMVSYTTASDLNAVKEFYAAQGAAQGWAYSDEMSMEGYLSFTITKGDKIFNVMVTPNEGGGSMVLLMAQQ